MNIEEYALAAARFLRDFCGEFHCGDCPFWPENDSNCQIYDIPFNWELPNKKPAGVRAPTSCGDDGLSNPINPEDNTFSEV